jgi:hypothetical protein
MTRSLEIRLAVRPSRVPQPSDLSLGGPALEPAIGAMRLCGRVVAIGPLQGANVGEMLVQVGSGA